MIVNIDDARIARARGVPLGEFLAAKEDVDKRFAEYQAAVYCKLLKSAGIYYTANPYEECEPGYIYYRDKCKELGVDCV